MQKNEDTRRGPNRPCDKAPDPILHGTPAEDRTGNGAPPPPCRVTKGGSLPCEILV